jgi:hypothetical protein
MVNIVCQDKYSTLKWDIPLVKQISHPPPDIPLEGGGIG